MSKIALHPRSSRVEEGPLTNPLLPRLLHTPSGLALLEVQGTIHLPDPDDEDILASAASNEVTAAQKTAIGRLVFSEYDPNDLSRTSWMKRVYLYVGKHQRLTGEVKKLPKAIAVIQKTGNGRLPRQSNGDAQVQGDAEETDELEVVEIVKYKILFSTRPEPVGTWAAEG